MATVDDILKELELAGKANVEGLIQGIQLKEPRLYQILHEMNRGLVAIQDALVPLVVKDRLPASILPVLPAPTSFTFIFTPVSVRFFWTEVLTSIGYEIREGTDWQFATFRLRTPSLQADIDPLLVGSYTFLIRTVNAVGIYSDSSLPLVVTVPPIGAIALRSSVIDNNVLLAWTAPSSTFRILHYETYKNGAFSGFVDSTFFSFFENVAGVYTYGVRAIDVAGNLGPMASVTVEVLTPPDYALQDQRVSMLLGTRVNVLRDAYVPSLIIAWSNQTWEEHFVTNLWDQIQDQLDAGFPIYIQPTTANGSYEEVIDYELIIHNTIVTVTYNYDMIDPEVTTVIKMASSLDNVTYSPFTSGASQYFQELRYLKLRLEFTGSDNKALMVLWNLTISISVKRENDGGEVYATFTSPSDPGTLVYFTKPFRDIESITCTTKSTTEPFYVIFDFVDIPDPTFFKVYVFDSSGNRVSRVVDWKARGII